MHALVGIGILAALIGFAFGERAAQLFVGVLLSIGALAVLGIVALIAMGRI